MERSDSITLGTLDDAKLMPNVVHFSHFTLNAFGKPLSGAIQSLALWARIFTVLTEGESVTDAEIIKWSKEQMAAYNYPRIAKIRETLPMTATGKTLKEDLKTASS